MPKNYVFMYMKLKTGEDIRLQRRTNPDGKVGGWVALKASIHKNVYIHPTSLVGPNVKLLSNQHVGANQVLR